jgi:NAD(P)H dehydrogenase (quinone)
MVNPKILVTGATGKTGGAVVKLMLKKGWPVRALVHRLDARSDELASLGAEVVVGDLFNVPQLLSAMQGIQRAYYCPPFHPYAVQSGMAFAIAAQEVKLEAVVGLSQWLASPDSPSIHTRHLWMIDRLLSGIPNLAYVNVNPGYFADNYLRLMDFATLLGVFPVLTGHSLNAPPSNEDIARVIAAALIDPDRHAGQRFRPTGPRLLSAYDMAAVIQKVVGSKVMPASLPWWMFERAARIQKVSAFEISSLRYYVEDHKQGAFAYGAPNEDVLRLTGSPAEDFEVTVRRYEAMPFVQKTFANRLRAFINFNRVPFTLGYGLDKFEQTLKFPPADAPLYAMESREWKNTHPIKG